MTVKSTDDGPKIRAIYGSYISRQCRHSHTHQLSLCPHAQQVLADDKHVQTGSCNYTMSAQQRNAENVIHVVEAADDRGSVQPGMATAIAAS
jgi:phosphatidylserine/phosphatidylglycerophosphate/cardiolipin synthase-like enzyme